MPSPFCHLALFLFLQQVIAATTFADVADSWIRPSGSADAQPIWGIKDGISVGLWPTRGPRGLIRIYTPYLDQKPGFIDQYIAVEPIVAGQRDLSEMQSSQSDKKQGKMMWTADNLDPSHPSSRTPTPARGQVANDNSLSFFIDVERFDNGAHPIIEITFHHDRPHEIALQTFAAQDSAPMESCVLSATMGNMSRLRHLHLQNRTVNAAELFQNDRHGYWDFFPWHDFRDLPIADGQITFAATGETDANPTDGPKSWRYQGVAARQSWRTKAGPDVIGRVNGRTTFWGTHADIPGGVAFENFELLAPFSQGQTFYFSVDRQK